MDISNIAIMIFSAASIWAFAGTKHPRLGFILGLCGQPFWIYKTFELSQWGMFLVSLWFTFNHLRGLWNRRGLAGPVKE